MNITYDMLDWYPLSRVGVSDTTLGLYSLSGKTSYRKISWSLEAARFGFNLFQSLWNLAGTSAALLPRYLSNFRALRLLQHPISRLRDFTRFGGKTSYRLVKRGPVYISMGKGLPEGNGQVRLGVRYVIIFLYVQFWNRLGTVSYRGKKVRTVDSPAVRSVNKSRNYVQNEPKYAICVLVATRLYYKALGNICVLW